MSKGDAEKETTPERVPSRARDRAVTCAACHHEITSPDQERSVQGDHTHRLTNPNGLTFTVRCFGDAPGVRALGPAESFFTWFAGHTWQVVLCGRCGAHLGWRFEGESVFHGLIADRIAE